MFSVLTFIEAEIRHHGFAPGLRDEWPRVGALRDLGAMHRPGRLTAAPRTGPSDWQKVEETVMDATSTDGEADGRCDHSQLSLEDLCLVTDLLAATPRTVRPRMTNGWHLVLNGARAVAAEGLKVGMDLSDHPHRAAMRALGLLNENGVVCSCPSC